MNLKLKYKRSLLALLMLLATILVWAQDDVSETEQAETTKKEVVDIYTERYIPGKKHSHILKDPEYAYANDPEYWIKEPPKRNPVRGFSSLLERFLFSEFTRFLFYCFLLVVAIVVIYRLAVQTGFFHRTATLNQGEESTAEDELLNLQNIDELLDASLKKSDFSRAVRLQYIKTLLLLDHQQWIQYNAQSTNTDYRYKLRKAPFFEDFDLMTSVYDHVCYGGFNINRMQFEMISDRFVHLQNKLRR